MNQSKTYYISLGSNLGDSIQLLKTAIINIKHELGEVLKISSFYETEPWGFESEYNFINAAIAVKSYLTPGEFMKKLLEIEMKMGRVRGQSGYYQNRVIDLDIIALENEVLKTESLEIPHPKMHLRGFVLLPFQEIAPDWVHPLLLKDLGELRALLIHEGKVNRLKI